jgi:hypothetical protein
MTYLLADWEKSDSKVIRGEESDNSGMQSRHYGNDPEKTWHSVYDMKGHRVMANRVFHPFLCPISVLLAGVWKVRHLIKRERTKLNAEISAKWRNDWYSITILTITNQVHTRSRTFVPTDMHWGSKGQNIITRIPFPYWSFDKLACLSSSLLSAIYLYRSCHM